MFGGFLLAAIAVSVWPAIHFLNSGGSFDSDWKPPEPLPQELAAASAIFLLSLLVSAILVIFGISWTILRAWKPFAVSLGVTTATLGGIAGFTALKILPQSLGIILFVIAAVVGGLVILYSIFLSLRNNLILITSIRLVGATLLAAAISILFPFLIFGVAIYLKTKRGMTFREVWSESPEIYNFVIVNIYPIFFQILPGLRYVQHKAKEEKKLHKKQLPPNYKSEIDFDRLRIGDVILTGSESWSSSMPIQASNILSASEDERYWCHSTIYAGDGKIVEALPEGQGVIVSDLSTYFDGGKRLRVLRHRFLGETELTRVVDFCREKAREGYPYDNWGVSFYALAALIPPMMSGWLEHPFAERFFNVEDSYFCSELIADAFLKCGHDVFGRRPWRVKPLDFAHTPLFEEIDANYRRHLATESMATGA